jgi:hypothetical protein
MYDSEGSVDLTNSSEMWQKPIENNYTNASEDDDEPPPLDGFQLDGDDSRYMRNSSSSDETMEELYSSLDECLDNKYFQSNDMMSIAQLVQGQQQQPKKKRQKTSDLRPVTIVRFATKKGSRQKPVTLVALLDSGASSTLVSEKFVKGLKLKCSTQSSVWTTPAGNLTTSKVCTTQMSLPEFHDNRVIEWTFHVTPKMGAYDMIIGQDILKDLGFILDFEELEVHWENASIPFKDMTKDVMESFYIDEPEAVQESMSRVKKILDNDYGEANLHEVARSQTHLTREEQDKLEELLRKYQDLFDGTLGKWTQPDCHLELKPDSKPYHAKAFPVPRVHMETLKQEVERLCKIGVLKRVNRSEWAAPTFIIPKKDGKVRFISDFRELNKRIKRMPYPIPNIQEMLLNLEGFQYATALDLNMGYYHFTVR